ncbi:MAG: CYTH domain-containing protein [Lachnospiraceae bacterium]|nr:CYTH domain-containing protein [Lachnospiraceae bacterium]
MGTEIERKYLIKEKPANLGQYTCHLIEQGYMNVNPVVRIRRQDNEYYMTYKGSGMIARTEYNLPLTEEAYHHLLPKCDGNIITKRRYLIPLENPLFANGFIPSTDLKLTIELDVFEGVFDSLIIAEIEFPDIETANALIKPDWFLEDVSEKREYHNSYLSRMTF